MRVFELMLPRNQRVDCIIRTGCVVSADLRESVSMESSSPILVGNGTIIPPSIKSASTLTQDIWVKQEDGEEFLLKLVDAEFPARESQQIVVVWWKTVSGPEVLLAVRNCSSGHYMQFNRQKLLRALTQPVVFDRSATALKLVASGGVGLVFLFLALVAFLSRDISAIYLLFSGLLGVAGGVLIRGAVRNIGAILNFGRKVTLEEERALAESDAIFSKVSALAVAY